MDSNLEDRRLPPRKFPLELLQRITNNFSEDHIIGRGGFGVVYKGVLDNGEEIALKKLNHIGLDIKNFTNEFNNIVRAHHQNIVQFVGYCYDQRERWIRLDSGQHVSALVVEGILCFEYLHGGNLESHLSDQQPCRPDWKTCYKIITGVCQGLNYLHNGQRDSIYHLDLKPANILLDNNMFPKIGDFGISRILLSTKTITTATRMMGTVGYMPLEYLKKHEISPKYDVFSLGAIIMQIMAGRQSYYCCGSVPSEETIKLVWGKWRRIDPTISLQTWHELKTCIGIALRCLEDDRQKRPSIAEIVVELNRIDIDKLSLRPKATSLEDLAFDYYENIGWSITMVGWVASATISTLLTKGYDYLGYNTAKKLERLHSKNLVLERVMEVVETSPHRPRLEQLFKELKPVYYEAEEILDDVEYHCLEKQIQDGKLQSDYDVPQHNKKYYPLKNKESGMSNKMLIESLKKIEDVINEAHQILDKLNLSSISSDNRRQKLVAFPTTADFLVQVFGRDNDALEDGQDRSTFQKIGAEIAKKLKGSHLAARSLQCEGGRNLCQQQEVDHWTRAREQDDFNGLMGPLWWTYYQLGEQARRCFAYCSIFPRRHCLYRDDIVRLWVAEGFIRNKDEGGDIEDVGQEIFSELLLISFLQLGGQDNHGKEYYLVHDLLHHLAEAVAGCDCFRIENNTSQKGGGWTGDVPRDVRHLFVQSYDATLITDKILELGKLHTLIIYSVGEDTPVEEIVIKKILKSLPKLRVLAIASSLEKEAFIHKPDTFPVPESVGQLKHLRYLAFRTDDERRVVLPSSLNQLYQMQLLDFGECNDLVFSCGDLIKLRHVCSGPGLKISNISKLVSLQTIPSFKVSNEQGHEAKQLRYLNRLSGELYISGLRSVESREEALAFDLAAKKRLTDLTLSFNGSLEVGAEVLEGLCPPVGLEKLSIMCYEGLVYPNWMVGRQNDGPEKLQQLTLYEWSQPGPAPALEAFIHLRYLYLQYCSWKALPGNMAHLSSLEELQIQGCLNVRSLPTLPQSLEDFTLCYCNDGFMKSCQTDGHPNWQKIQHIGKKRFV